MTPPKSVHVNVNTQKINSIYQKKKTGFFKSFEINFKEIKL